MLKTILWRLWAYVNNYFPLKFYFQIKKLIGLTVCVTLVENLETGETNMKVGLIRCMQTEDMCPVTTDFKVMREKKCAFVGVEDEIELIGLTTCGGWAVAARRP
jgi:hypothetical protein